MKEFRKYFLLPIVIFFLVLGVSAIIQFKSSKARKPEPMQEKKEKNIFVRDIAVLWKGKKISVGRVYANKKFIKVESFDRFELLNIALMDCYKCRWEEGEPKGAGNTIRMVIALKKNVITAVPNLFYQSKFDVEIDDYFRPASNDGQLPKAQYLFSYDPGVD